VSTGMLAYVPLMGEHLQAWIREDGQVGPSTLHLFHSIHTAIVPAVLTGLMAFHFWRVRKARGLVVPRRPNETMEEKPDRISSMPDLLLREIVVALVLVAAVLQLSIFLDAPLGDAANPGLSPNPTRAPWYFAGLQELLLHLHPVVAVCIIPVLTVGLLLMVPYLKYPVDSGGIWFASHIGRTTSVIAAVAGALLAALAIVLHEWLSEGFIGERLPPLVGQGIAPVALLAGTIVVFLLMIRRRFHANRNEWVQAVFILLFSGYAILTFTGIWIRGAGMELAFSW